MSDETIDQEYEQRYLRFLHRKIMDPDRCWTLRVQFERDFRRGMRVALKDEDGYVFAYSRVECVIDSTVEHIYDLQLDGYPRHCSLGHLNNSLNSYYSGVTVGSKTECTAIKLSDPNPVWCGVEVDSSHLQDRGGHQHSFRLHQETVEDSISSLVETDDNYNTYLALELLRSLKGSDITETRKHELGKKIREAWNEA